MSDEVPEISVLMTVFNGERYLAETVDKIFDAIDVARTRATYRLPLRQITISRWLVNILEGEYGAPPPILVPNSVNLEQFNAPPRTKHTRPTVGMMYSRTAFNGCDISLRALETVKQQMPDLHLVTFGTHPSARPIKLPAWAEHHVQPAQDRIKNLYAACDVWLVGSRSEGFCLPMLEAMACRCPVVSTRVGGPLDLIRDGENGYLVDVEDSDALADRLLRVLKLEPPQWKRMSDAAYATAIGYTWDDATELFEQALESVAQGVSPAQRNESVAGRRTT